jgi:hypothetical protein
LLQTQNSGDFKDKCDLAEKGDLFGQCKYRDLLLYWKGHFVSFPVDSSEKGLHKAI